MALSPGITNTREGQTYMFSIIGPGKAPLTPNIEKIVLHGTVVERSMLDTMGMLKLNNLRWDRTSPYNIKDIKGLTLKTDSKSKTGYSAFLTPSAYEWSVAPSSGGMSRKTRKRKTRQRKTRHRK